MDRGKSTRKKLAQYIRVSSEEQAKRGFSIPDQKRELDLWAESRGHQVIATEIDDGYESWILERPGLDKIRDLVAAKAVDMVVVWRRDRLSREPAHIWLLENEFQDAGVSLIFLDTPEDDSPEGQFMAGIRDQVNKYERLVIKERTRRGSMQKARQGKIIMGRRVNYGFKPNATRDGYEIDPDTAPIVRRIFDMVGVQGLTLYAVADILNREGIPSPTGKTWTRPVLRSMLLNDVYTGTWYYNRRKVKRSREAGTYRRKTKTKIKPKEEWLSVPVPDIGIPRPVVEAARQAVLSNRRSSRAADRTWELDSGLLRCECGRHMCPRTIHNPGEKPRLYYICGSYNVRPRPCSAVKHYRAELVEETVAAMVEPLISDPDRLVAHVNERIEQERRRLGRVSQDGTRIADRIQKLDNMRRGYQRQAAEDLITIDELKAALAEIEDERTQLTDMLTNAQNAAEHIAQMEREAKIIIGMYAGRLAAFRNLQPEQRQEVYRRLGIKATIDRNGVLTVDGNLAANFVPLQDEINGGLLNIRPTTLPPEAR